MSDAATARRNAEAIEQYTNQLLRVVHLTEVGAPTGALQLDPDQVAIHILDKIVARAGALMAHYRGRIAAREEDGA